MRFLVMAFLFFMVWLSLTAEPLMYFFMGKEELPKDSEVIDVIEMVLGMLLAALVYESREK